MTFRADLHSHSTCSDGSATPQELVRLAKQNGLSGLSITDHDTISAYETAIPEAKALGILLGTGVEFSSMHDGKNVHILGYDYSLSSSAIREFCIKHQMRRRERNRKILDKLARLNMFIKEEELGESRTVGRPHIAQAMVKKGYVSTFKEAFNLYLADDKRCYDPGVSFSVEETLEVIHQAEGKAFLAHPHLMDDGRKIKELLKLKFDGIECHYSKCHPSKEKRWLKVAKERGLLISGGSDFHGEVKPQIPLGCSWVDEETFYRIFTSLKHVQKNY